MPGRRPRDLHVSHGKEMLPLRPHPGLILKPSFSTAGLSWCPQQGLAPRAMNRTYASSSDTQQTPVERSSRSHCTGEDPGTKARCPNGGPADKSQNQHVTSDSKSIHFPTALYSTPSMSNHNF